MHVALFISAIVAFIFSFIPLLGIAGTVVFSIISIMLSIVSLKKSKDITKGQKEVSIISLVISTIAIVICVIINIFAVKCMAEFIENFGKLSEISYISTIEELEEHNMGEKISLDDGNFEITVNESSSDGDIFVVNITLESINENKTIYLYDFYIYNMNNGEIYYPEYEVEGDFSAREEILPGESVQGNIKFEIESYNSDGNLYLIFNNDDNDIKIKI